MLSAISARDIAVSGMRAQRVRMTVIANNLANAHTTRTPGGGGAFVRQVPIFRGERIRHGAAKELVGVRVKNVVADPSPLRSVYDPAHPDANEEGYVNYPNIDTAVEMANLIAAQRAYEANMAVLASGSRINQRALDFLQQN